MENKISHFHLIPKLSQKNVFNHIIIPTVCRESYLNEDDKRIYNESKHWVQSLQDNVPIWSPIKNLNCVGQHSQVTITKDNHYEIEIPQRLLSLWGNQLLHNEILQKMESFSGYRLVNNILALCMCLKYDLDKWSFCMLDEIIKMGVAKYRDLLRKSNISDREFHIKHLASTYRFEDKEFSVQLHQVATGLLYMPYGLNEFNLARALRWFFQYYQFGLLQCNNRCLAFGFAVDVNHGYFMYDCQSTGKPLFGESETNSYILRTNHLQILLYCLIVTLRVVSDNEKFLIYNVNIQMQDIEKPIDVCKKPILKFPSRFGCHKKLVAKVTNSPLQSAEK